MKRCLLVLVSCIGILGVGLLIKIQLNKHSSSFSCTKKHLQDVPTQSVVQNIPELTETKLIKDVERIAREITVRIDMSDGNNGSGIIIAGQGHTYHVLTATHVVNKQSLSYEVTTVDGRCYPINYSSVKRFNGVDLALLEFNSNETYQVAKLANYDLSKEDKYVFVSGWAASTKESRAKPNFLFTPGLISNKEDTGFRTLFNAKDSGSLIEGYELIYSNITAPGVSGGSVLDTQGRLIGIHGKADGFSVIGGNRVILGFSLGIPISTFLSVQSQLGIGSKLTLEVSDPLQLTKQQKTEINQYLLGVPIKPKANADGIKWLNYGNQLWRIARLQEAIRAFDKAIQIQPNFSEAFYAKGLMLALKGKYQEAIVAYDKAIISLKRVSAKENEYLALAWRDRGSMLSILKDEKRALISFDKAIALNSNDFSLQWSRGNTLENLNHYREAISAYSQAINIYPYPLAYNSRGNAHTFLKDYKQALDDLNQAIKLKPNYSEAYQNRGVVYYKLKDYKQALDDLNQAIKLKPNYSEAYLNRGNIYFDNKKYKQALVNFNEAIRLKPKLNLGYYNRGNVYRSLKQNKQALKDYTQAISIQPGYAPAYNNRGGIYYELQNYEQAVTDFTQATHLKLNYTDAYYNRGNTYSKLEEYKKAIADFNQVILQQPDYPDVYYIRGNTYSELKQYKKAIADFNQVILQQPNHPNAYLNRGAAYFSFGDNQAAIKDTQKASQLYHKQGNMDGYQIAQENLQNFMH